MIERAVDAPIDRRRGSVAFADLRKPPIRKGAPSLTIAVSSLFRALSFEPASVVVPIYRMFIVGGSVPGVIVLGEAIAAAKAAGLTLAVAGVLLIAR